eukprot:GHVN01035523.1.p1 GENE.GHVN01035523.1~~GHVN01035523.1.p1  ORF type:complete len:1282 (-),score=179.66 GHVN01035523.1:2011-5454(-)
MLDEECVVIQGSDKKFTSKIITKHKAHPRFGELKTKADWFVVQHFAGPVQYCSAGFLDKNKDQLSPDTTKVVLESPNEFVATLFKDLLQRGEHTQSKKQATVSSEFKTQLTSLMETVDVTEPHFIRCIKPNPENCADFFDRKSVTEQLRYGGVLQAVQVSRAGYPVRVLHQVCFDDYKYLAPTGVTSERFKGENYKERAVRVMTHLATSLPIPAPKHGATSWAVGDTLVFFKHEAFEILQSARMKLHAEKAVLLQSRWKGMRQRFFYLTIRRCAIIIQALMRGKIGRLRANNLKKESACIKLQAFFRRVLARIKYRRMIRQVVLIQALYRGRKGRVYVGEYKKHRAATKVQAYWKGSIESANYKKLRIGVMKAQLRWRSLTARRQLRRLRQEQKETATLLTQKQKLQHDVKSSGKQLQEEDARMYMVLAEREALKILAEQLREELAQLKAGVAVPERPSASKARSLGSPTKATRPTSPNDGHIEQLRARLAEGLTQVDEQKRENAELMQKYQTVVNSGNLTYRLPADAQKLGLQHSRPAEAQKYVDILIVGGVNVGKTQLVKKVFTNLKDEANCSKLQRYEESHEKSVQRYFVKMDSRELSLIVVPGDPHHDQYVADMMSKAHKILIVYNLVEANGEKRALQLLGMGGHNTGRIILFGNNYDHDRSKSNLMVNIATLKDSGASVGATCVEGADIGGLLQNIARELDFEMESTLVSSPSALLDQSTRERHRHDSPVRHSTLSSQIVNRFKNMFRSSSRQQVGEFLNFSAKGHKMVYQTLPEQPSLGRGVLPATEIRNGSETLNVAVTCIAFGQERLRLRYILLALASKDGTVLIYRVYRTDMEKEMLKLNQEIFPEPDDDLPPPTDGSVALHHKLLGHQKAVTSLFFSSDEDRLVTSSIDKTLRLWDVATGEMRRVFSDTSPALVAAFLPLLPNTVVTSNSQSVLRFFEVGNGTVLQKLKLESEVRTLCFDDTGLFCFAGTKQGTIHVLEFDSFKFNFKFNFNLTKAAITCIQFVASTHPDVPPCLLVNATDNYVAVVDCMYPSPAPTGELASLRVRYRDRIEHTILPLRCCHSPVGGGWLITGSEGHEVVVYALGNGKQQRQRAVLPHHKHPVLCVSINAQSTLLASADSGGLTVLWRRFDFSHFDQ